MNEGDELRKGFLRVGRELILDLTPASVQCIEGTMTPGASP